MQATQLEEPKGNGVSLRDQREMASTSTIRYSLQGKWRYASSEREMEICKQPKGKWRFASSIAERDQREMDMQAAKRD